jgi:hypothetical protein
VNITRLQDERNAISALAVKISGMPELGLPEQAWPGFN